ncbi:1-acyl-sn-glycerol-3-phosphate acyltransferase [Geothrix oryzisoli]|uniref:1-acyl-sn-glycerol-3-phosphate acyltransferase n=1 Tax=Geothrix oryzisoli TaxID=2922721 RepID=UPI001FAE254E|nr:1-acyl-sn-glycerol-3-phosphate acyltransferase [Geothrix oryzisoli]
MAASRVAGYLGRIWFRALRREGPPLPPGPCLILLNHPNGLLDPLAAAALLDRRAGWLAKATLWKVAPLRPFLGAFRAIPVTRPRDGGATPESIQQCFRKVHEVLAGGGSVAMFPEGVSHSEADLAPLKTGAARMALTSPTPVSLVPAGLVYGDRATFRHSVLLRVGDPVAWEDLAPRGDDPEAVAELTVRIRAALKPLTLHDPEVRVLALAQEVAWLLAEAPGSRVDLEALRRRVRALVPHLVALPGEDLAALESRVHEAQAWLRAKGVRPDQVGHPYPGAEIRHWLPGAALRLGLAALLLPLALLFWPSYRLVGWAARRFTDEGDQTATLKLLGGLMIHPFWAALLTALAGWLWGWPTALVPPVALLLVLLGLPALERAGEDLQAIRGFRRRRDPAVPELLEARRQLIEAFPELDP